MELLNLTMTEATEYAIAKIMEEFEFNKKTAQQFFKNAITYNVVIEEIVNQVGFMIDFEELGE